ncbi:hypothetical protein TSUD_407650 [Trifolium subterraneum]|uniref:Replication protein A 70 kDa DNA-binding subunit B/D first OB fold domain-containing protein n=1 Tax=Trifolium subterraneum TaxID=3900 RepID=A0A2Z6PFH9_TRISU|nr:hypothetical protein TSUD_407650 [Trifolium subterraneum]
MVVVRKHDGERNKEEKRNIDKYEKVHKALSVFIVGWIHSSCYGVDPLEMVVIETTDAWVVQMVICDAKGDNAHIIAPTVYANQYKAELVENNTFILQNFEIEKNDLTIKYCHHPFKFILNGNTLLQDLNEFEIAKPGFKFVPFDEIKNGKVRKDVLIDVIGSFHELGYTQLVPGGARKVHINFKIKDLTGNILPCILWELFAEKFVKYNNERKDDGPVVILIHNAMIKEAIDKYELGVSNAWNSTKLFINEDLPEIVPFQKRFAYIKKGCGSGDLELSTTSQGQPSLS